MKPLNDRFFIITDWGWLPDNIHDSWVHKLSDNYVVYDRKLRWPQSEKNIHQINVGQNIYDMFDYIASHFYNLPEIMVFSKASVCFPKDTGVPRINENGEVLPNGHCSQEYFDKVITNKTITELSDYGTEDWRFDGRSCKKGPGVSFMEHNKGWYFYHYPRKYYCDLNTFFDDIYDNPPRLEWIRFSPGACYIVPKNNLVRYNLDFFKRIRDIVSWGPVIAKAHMIERALYTIFTCDWKIKEKYAT